MSSNNKGVVDRIEGDRIIIEMDENIINLSINYCPSGIREGDIVIVKDNTVEILIEETKEKKKNVKKMVKELWQD